MDRLSNPYRPGAGTEPPAMLGRDELIDAFGVTERRALDGRPGRTAVSPRILKFGAIVALSAIIAPNFGGGSVRRLRVSPSRDAIKVEAGRTDG